MRRLQIRRQYDEHDLVEGDYPSPSKSSQIRENPGMLLGRGRGLRRNRSIRTVRFKPLTNNEIHHVPGETTTGNQ